MKRISCLALTIVASSSLLSPTARAQAVGAYAMEVVEAHADWVADRGRGWVEFRFISVGRYTDPAGPTQTIADVGKVQCSIRDTRQAWISSCKITARFLPMKGGRFQVDGLLRNAQVVLKDSGMTHRAVWAAKDDARDPSWLLQGGERSMAVRASARADATVEGRVLGERFTTRGNQAHAHLRRYAEAGVIYETGPTPFVARSPSYARAWRSVRAFVASL